MSTVKTVDRSFWRCGQGMSIGILLRLRSSVPALEPISNRQFSGFLLGRFNLHQPDGAITGLERKRIGTLCGLGIDHHPRGSGSVLRQPVQNLAGFLDGQFVEGDEFQTTAFSTLEESVSEV